MVKCSEEGGGLVKEEELELEWEEGLLEWEEGLLEWEELRALLLEAGGGE